MLLNNPTVGQKSQSQNAALRYDAAARTFHWAIALLIAAMFATDWLREAAPRDAPSRSLLLSTHESLGLLVLGVSIALAFSGD